jgi:ElaA protein
VSTPDPAAPSALVTPVRVWRYGAFEALSPRELQYIYRARQAVFVVEQHCPFIDADGLDERAHHLACWAPSQPEPLAYARLLEPGAKYADASIGRVLTTAAVRGSGLGRELMARALAHAATTWPGRSVRISAQSRLGAFYASFGFVAVGARYLEDGIDHTEMLLAHNVGSWARPRP